MIELSDIHYRAGSDFALEAIGLRLELGAFHVLLGPTGGGKSLLLELIAGLRRPQRGSICIGGVPMEQLNPERRHIAYVPQDNALFPHLKVFDNIAYGLRFAPGWSARAKQEKVRSLAETLHISHLLDRWPAGLSGGEQQRVALARALAVDEKIVLLDEPTAAVHESLQEELCLFFRQLQRQFGLTVVMTTHHRDSAFMLADHLHIIEKGRLILSCPKERLSSQTLSPSAARFLGISNIFVFRVLNRSGHTVQAWCEALNARFTFSSPHGPWASRDRFALGLRPEDIRVVKEEDYGRAEENVFAAEIISVLHKESSTSIQLCPVGAATRVMMDISRYNQEKFALLPGKAIRCKIKESAARVVEGEVDASTTP